MEVEAVGEKNERVEGTELVERAAVLEKVRGTERKESDL